MTFTKQDEGGFWISGPLVAVLLAGGFGAAGWVYQWQNARLWEDGNSIVELKAEVTNISNENARIEAHLVAIDSNVTTISAGIEGIKAVSDGQKDQLHDVQRQISDLDHVLRPGGDGGSGH